MYMTESQGVSRVVDGPHTYVEGKVITKTPCINMATVLRENHISHINFFSLDVEGSELAVIQRYEISPLSSFGLHLTYMYLLCRLILVVSIGVR